MRVHNLLTDRLIRFETPDGLEQGSLPDIYAALMADRIESFPALRAHQGPAWHMFLAQLGAIACHRARLSTPPDDAATWQDIIGQLTRDQFPDDEPWCLVVDDWSKPAFLQPSVPEDLSLKGEDDDKRSPDALDMLITSRNHDLKQSVATGASLDDWLFALVSLQTMEGYGGPKNYGISRMNGGSSSRVLMGLSPLPMNAVDHSVRVGRWLKRDISQLLARRDEVLNGSSLSYPPAAGVALTWTVAWPEGDQLLLDQLDIWFIEVCRRVRLRRIGDTLRASMGNSSTERIKAKHLNGFVGDPWAPVHRIEKKSLTIGDEGTFHYTRVVDLLFSGDWFLPSLAELGDDEADEVGNWLLVIAAIARGNSKTGGFKSRAIPLEGRQARGLIAKRAELHDVARELTGEIKKIDNALRYALALATASGVADNIDKNSYARAHPYSNRLDAAADRLFFPALWERFEAEQEGTAIDVERARRSFLLPLIDVARDLLKEGLADIPCPAIRRRRAEARALRAFEGRLRNANPKIGFPGLFMNDPDVDQEMTDAA